MSFEDPKEKMIVFIFFAMLLAQAAMTIGVMIEHTNDKAFGSIYRDDYTEHMAIFTTVSIFVAMGGIAYIVLPFARGRGSY